MEDIKIIFQDSNVNFLIGSGLSAGYLSTLNTIEKDITEANKLTDDSEKRAKLSQHYSTYFEDVIEKNLNILPSITPPTADRLKIESVLESYQFFFDGLRELLFHRKSSILNKQANVFTTNIDLFMEIALDDIGLEYNDGFIGRFDPLFSSSNFKKIYLQKSQHFDNESEIPSLNIIKMHGSLTWESTDDGSIGFTDRLDQVVAVKDAKETGAFIKEYDKLCIVNPSKEKFKDTLLNQNYYDLLRIYSNELERENTSLFVMGFSFADEHIREITIRVANANPTLVIYIFSYDQDSTTDIDALFKDTIIKNKNIVLILPDEEQNEAGEIKIIPNCFDQINEKFITALLSKING